MPLSKEDFSFVSGQVFKESGIVLESDKDYLVDARLTAVIRKLGIATIEELVRKLRAPGSAPLMHTVVEAMTTNETSFFRDIKPFDALKKSVLPELIKRRAAAKSLSIWCAASSSGQEPYTIAMSLCEAVPDLANWKLKFVATDLSKQMVDRCKAGKFSQIEINRGLPAPLLVKYFKQTGVDWEIDPKLRKMIDFRELNLLGAWSGLQNLDIVFIRNVLIYFDTQTKRTILGRIKRLLNPDGYLFLGGAETTLNLDEGFDRLPVDRSGCYVIKPPAPLGAIKPPAIAA
jgi:chemotaxis protein methyltransferase CheR